MHSDTSAIIAGGTAARNGRARVIWAIEVLVLLALAVFVRVWNVDAIFASSDQAAMAYMVRHTFGVEWVANHNYGPTLPVIQRATAELFSAVGLPLDEASARWPAVYFSLAQVLLTYPLLRRARVSPGGALLGVAFCAVLPTLVTDAHYPWCYHTVWLFFGSLALWATWAYRDDRRTWQAVVAGAALFAHCLSNMQAMALPLTLLGVWCFDRREPAEPGESTKRPWRAFLLIYVVPSVLALAVIVGCWVWTGGGQLGHLVTKGDNQTLGWHWGQIVKLPGLWVRQLGLLYGLMCGGALLVGWRWLLRRERAGWLVFWAWTALVPFVLVARWDAIGYANHYMFEILYAAMLVGTIGLCRLGQAFGRMQRQGMAVVMVALLQLTGASIDVAIPADLQKWTGIHTGWGNVKPDTGIKAAACYVRDHVPLEAAVLTLHDNRDMEVPVAEYYLGRKVLADYDLREPQIGPLLDRVSHLAEVIVTPVRLRGKVASRPGFVLVATILEGTTPVREVYARPALGLPDAAVQVAEANRRYDRTYLPAHVPIPLPAAPGFEAKLGEYQSSLRAIRVSAGP